MSLALSHALPKPAVHAPLLLDDSTAAATNFMPATPLFYARVRKGRRHILFATARANEPLDGGVEIGEGWEEVLVMPRGHPQVRGDRRGQVEFSASPVSNIAAIAVGALAGIRLAPDAIQ